MDAKHAHNLVTRWSITRIVVPANNMPICGVSKHQKKVKSSAYGLDLVASQIATQLILELCHMPCMIGVPLDSPALMLEGVNMSMAVTTTLSSSMFNKKHCTIVYCCMKDSIASGILNFKHIPSKDQLVPPWQNHSPISNFAHCPRVYFLDCLFMSRPS